MPSPTVWVSHSSLSDYLKCPRAYYLKNVYKDPRSNHKISIMTPPLALGQAVHAVLEGLSLLPAEDRFATPLLDRYESAWEAVVGRLGGFTSLTQEHEYKERGSAMLRRVERNPAPLQRKAIKINAPGNLPRYLLSEAEDIVLCGKIDWLEYFPDDDSVHILDFKTGKQDEVDGSLQLPIYHLLVDALQKRPVRKASYWYLDRADEPVTVSLPELTKAREDVLRLALDVKWARTNAYRICAEDGCFACRDYQAILDGRAEFVGVGAYNQDVYVIPS
jgi:ATP-dependent helicase/DNAse subunit B